ncbi:DUF1028 domain-containing protein [Corynebacterium pacaense]|uniref:DUF1028 domain-containing protein n=1 Tax=Corynebacterium pacaense TaxID=1816684 RepID=UPI0009BC70DB|nr:DUF1028 domain-containing protein [Corynebacterium pacaense]
MTFSIIARDATGAFGMAVSSSSPAVAARCLHLRSGVGAVASQNITDPRFGHLLLDQLAAGGTAQSALEWLSTRDSTLDYRQICVLGTSGAGIAHSGKRVLGCSHQIAGPETSGEASVTAGNMLKTPTVVDAMHTSFNSSSGDLEIRLLIALEAGLAEGGEEGDVHSAGLAVVRDSGWKESDLRVDWSQNPIPELRTLLELWLPQRDDYVTRGIHPATAPSYGVPGDE